MRIGEAEAGTKVVFQGRWMALGDLLEDKSLRRALRRDGAPYCACVLGPVLPRLRVAMHADSVWVRSCPGDASLHAAGCRFRLDASPDVDRRERAGGFVLPPPGVAAAGVDGAAPVADDSGPDLQPLLWAVWTEAGLNRWDGGSGRNWAACRTEVLGALERLGGATAFPFPLLVLRQYHRALRETMDAELEALFRSFGLSARQPRSAVILSPLKRIEVEERGAWMSLDNTLRRFKVKSQVAQRIRARYAEAIELSERDDGCAIALVRLGRGRDGYPEVVDAAILPATQEYLPCWTDAQGQLLAMLVKSRRTFACPGAGEPVADDVVPDVVLQDTVPVTAVYIQDGTTLHHDSSRTRGVGLMRLLGVRHVVWDPSLPLLG
ncbi:DUF1173 family protein [Cupriavidus sp. USMAA2-4]|uniref:DUF1173 family protein n=1 Tax=Cupriavidus sp. USMAA2-4 TaxID=876364 RepID=UPI000A05DB67